MIMDDKKAKLISHWILTLTSGAGLANPIGRRMLVALI